MILGPDVSKWQGTMDWPLCKDAGAKFAFIRAGSITNVTGQCYEDSQFDRNASIAPDLMPVGYYWYFRPQHSPTEQADYFCNLVLMHDFSLPPVADIENNGGLSPAAYADSIKAFLDRVESLTGYKPIIYTSSSKWAQVEPRPYWGDYDLWVAHYTASPDPLVPSAWPKWWFWQYTSSGHGPTYGASSARIDLNRFNGDEAEFMEYLGVVVPKIPKIVRVTAVNGALVRDLPKAGIIRRVEPLDALLGVEDVDEDVNGLPWYYVGSGWVRSDNVKEQE